MIIFFRNIRQKNLIDNKFGKHLTYAFSEIELVFIFNYFNESLPSLEGIKGWVKL